MVRRQKTIIQICKDSPLHSQTLSSLQNESARIIRSLQLCIRLVILRLHTLHMLLERIQILPKRKAPSVLQNKQRAIIRQTLSTSRKALKNNRLLRAIFISTSPLRFFRARPPWPWPPSPSLSVWGGGLEGLKPPVRGAGPPVP